MSVTRSLLNEFRPLFRLLDDPFDTASDPFTVAPRAQQADREQEQSNAIQSLFGVPSSTLTRSPHVHMTEEGDKYIVEAEIPGVPKENLDVSIGDNGRSLTIKGNTFASSEQSEVTPQSQAQVSTSSEKATPADQAGKSSTEGEHSL